MNYRRKKSRGPMFKIDTTCTWILNTWKQDSVWNLLVNMMEIKESVEVEYYAYNVRIDKFEMLKWISY